MKDWIFLALTFFFGFLSSYEYKQYTEDPHYSSNGDLETFGLLAIICAVVQILIWVAGGLIYIAGQI